MDGVGPSKIKSICHPGGEMPAFGGAVIAQELPAHVNAGKMVLPPIVLPCVLDVAATERFSVSPGFLDEGRYY